RCVQVTPVLGASMSGLCDDPVWVGRSRGRTCSRHRPHYRDEQGHLALAQLVLSAGVEEGAEYRLHAGLRVCREEGLERNPETAGDPRQGLQVRRALTSLDHREEGDADARPTAEVLLRHARPGTRDPEQADPPPHVLDDVAWAHL